MPSYIHHIQWCVSDLDQILSTLVDGYGFSILASRDGANKEVVVRGADITFLLSQRINHQVQCTTREEYPYLNCSCRFDSFHEVDSVFNICLEVDEVENTFANMVNNGSKILHPPTTVRTTKTGSVQFAVVTSPCENVIHSLVNTSNYEGSFLPGFTFNGEVESNTDNFMMSNIDHLTFVVNQGETQAILQWYQDCCGMKRFLMSDQEDPENGYVFDDVGMKLTAGDWISEWLCVEKGVRSPDDINFKLVIAEPLPDRQDSHVNR